MVICHFPYGPTAYFSLHNVVLRHDIPDRGTVSEQYPHLIMDNFGSKLGKRVSNILKYLFPVPKEDSKRVLTFANQNDYISFRHHVYQKINGSPQIAEVGPRFEMKGKIFNLFKMTFKFMKLNWELWISMKQMLNGVLDLINVLQKREISYNKKLLQIQFICFLFVDFFTH